MYYQKIGTGQLYMMVYSQALAQHQNYPTKEWYQEIKVEQQTILTQKCDLCSDEFSCANYKRVNMKGDLDKNGYFMCPYCEATCREKTEELSLCYIRS